MATIWELVILLLAFGGIVLCSIFCAKFYIRKRKEPGYFSVTDNAWPIFLIILGIVALGIVILMILALAGTLQL